MFLLTFYQVCVLSTLCNEADCIQKYDVMTFVIETHGAVKQHTGKKA